MSALRGNLRDFGIAEVFQLIGQQRKTGVLEIDRDGEQVELTFDGGAVVMAEPVTGVPDGALADLLLRCGMLTRDAILELQREAATSLRRLSAIVLERGALEAAALARIEDLLTQETIFQVLGWDDGSFAFSAKAVEHDREGRLLAAEQILMDGLRMVDEWKTFADQIPSEETVFQRTGRLEDWDAVRQGGGPQIEHAKRVFQLVDGRLSVRRVIDLARLGTFEVTRILAELRRAGLVEPLDPSQVPEPPAPRVLEPRRPRARPLLAALLPLVLLAALAVTALPAPARRDPRAGYPLGGDPLAQARSAYETERVRKALEAFHFQNGHWPDTLDELVADGFLEASALTTSAGRPYYYERRGDATALLAPRH
jgi:hypothetical protein